MVGTLKGTDGYFQNNVPQVSSHFGVGLYGEPISQYVDLSDAAHANGIFGSGSKWAARFGLAWPNGRTISIETDDTTGFPQHNAPVTDLMYRDTLAACRVAMRRHSTIKYLTAHHMIDPVNKSGCPGQRWTVSGRLADLAKTTGLELFI